MASITRFFVIFFAFLVAIMAAGVVLALGVVAPDFSGIDSQIMSNHVQLRFKCKSHVNCAMSTHRTTGRSVGEHSIAIVFHVANVIDGAKQCSGI